MRYPEAEVNEQEEMRTPGWCRPRTQAEAPMQKQCGTHVQIQQAERGRQAWCRQSIEAEKRAE